MNSSHREDNDKDMIKWYEFNVECMIKRGIKVLNISCYEDINDTIFFDIILKESRTLIEEGAEHCFKYKSKKTMSIDV